MEVKGDDYRVWYEPSEMAIYCQGSLRLAGTEEYAPIVQILEKSLEEPPKKIKLNLCQLEFLNSSGINILSKFVIKVRQKETISIIVQGSEVIPWQGKSLKNLQRLMPSLKLEWI
ncbi:MULTISPECIES: slr1659 superfamily regulator [Pseudanabaena]|uniref:STAS domain-containing protein n=2 Tax=Pseudanabaena TaxID=1152 RepID=L8N0B8_9CYAN|nr:MULTISPECIES: hypothetical protein [Pseudanabaena]ELS32180.1 hypothetical protein Pse7429DRAFT_2594 [Pseudanabaena biceps PCC 7429]MDG3495581.1 hypothetical protein [Pseudanabaena catenata USMAC16]